MRYVSNYLLMVNYIFVKLKLIIAPIAQGYFKKYFEVELTITKTGTAA